MILQKATPVHYNLIKNNITQKSENKLWGAFTLILQIVCALLRFHFVLLKRIKSGTFFLSWETFFKNI